MTDDSAGAPDEKPRCSRLQRLLVAFTARVVLSLIVLAYVRSFLWAYIRLLKAGSSPWGAILSLVDGLFVGTLVGFLVVVISWRFDRGQK